MHRPPRRSDSRCNDYMFHFSNDLLLGSQKSEIPILQKTDGKLLLLGVN